MAKPQRSETCFRPGAFTLERVTGIEPALSAWESERSGLLCSLTCLARCLEMTVANRWLPGLTGTLMARTRGCGVPRAGAGKILPRPRRTVGGEKAGRPEPYKRGYGGREPPVPPARCRWVMSHYDAHLCRLVRSPASAMTSVDRWARLLQGLGVSPSHHSPVRLVHKSVHTDFR
jgi:hypothetical protein